MHWSNSYVLFLLSITNQQPTGCQLELARFHSQWIMKFHGCGSEPCTCSWKFALNAGMASTGNSIATGYLTESFQEYIEEWSLMMTCWNPSLWSHVYLCWQTINLESRQELFGYTEHTLHHIAFICFLIIGCQSWFHNWLSYLLWT
jgi:hypothetical protein